MKLLIYFYFLVLQVRSDNPPPSITKIKIGTIEESHWVIDESFNATYASSKSHIPTPTYPR